MQGGEAAEKLKTFQHLVPNQDGWLLSLHQTWDERRLVESRRPVLIVPGYGMNSFIFSYHPRGLSLEGFLATAGFEVWRVDLRAQGGSVSVGGGDDYRIEDLAVTDLGAAIDAALAHTRTAADRADILGCSLGGTFMFVHAALNPRHRMGSMVAMGSPVRWVRIHPILRAAFAWPMLVGAIRVKGTRRFAELVLPHLVRRLPWLLSIYLNPSITDTDAVREMVKTVEDPNRHINREIAHWIKDRDLVLRGINVSEALPQMNGPLLCALANGDGIVPRETAEFPYVQTGATSKRLLEIGSEEVSMAHADMFVSNEAHARVFAPIATWLAEQGPL